MAHKKDKRALVRQFYVADRQNVKAAAKLAGVSYSAALEWKERDRKLGMSWEHARLAHRMSEGGAGSMVRVLIEDLAPLAQSTIELLKDQNKDVKIGTVEKVECIASLADSLAKISKVAGMLDPAAAKLSIGMDTMKRLAQFTAEKFPQHQETLLEILEPFGLEIAHEGG